MKRLALLLLLALFACEVADDDHSLHTEPAVIVQVAPPITQIYYNPDEHPSTEIFLEVFRGLPPYAVHLDAGDWRTITVAFSAPPQDLSIYHSAGAGGENNLFGGHRLDGAKLYIDLYCPSELTDYDVSPYGEIHLKWRSGSRILRTWCQSKINIGRRID